MKMNPRGPGTNGGQSASHPAINRVVRQNIKTIIEQREQTARERTLHERIADAITDFSGSLVFVYVHIAWFGLWILLNSGFFGIHPFDPFPYGLLTMVVSLEAIFLSTFVLISQNRMSKESEDRAELDLQINLLTERELTRVLKMLVAVEAKLGIENNYDSELAELEKETKPEDVLKEIQEDKKREKEQKR